MLASALWLSKVQPDMAGQWGRHRPVDWQESWLGAQSCVAFNGLPLLSQQACLMISFTAALEQPAATSAAGSAA